MSGDQSRIEWEEVCRVLAAAQILQHTPDALSYAQARAHGMAWTDDLNAKWIAWRAALRELREAVERLKEGQWEMG